MRASQCMRVPTPLASIAAARSKGGLQGWGEVRVAPHRRHRSPPASPVLCLPGANAPNIRSRSGSRLTLNGLQYSMHTPPAQ